VHGVDPRVVIAPGGRYPEGVRRALRLGPATEAQRQAFVAANSWARRHEDVIALAFG
jgi:hypothetical protein